MPVFSFDITASQILQSFQPPWLTFIMKCVSVVAAPELLIIIFLVIAGYFMYQRDVIRGKYLVILLSGNLLTPMLKALIARPRPNDGLAVILTHNSGYSFPSGHALGIVIFCSAILLINNKRFSLLTFLLSAIIILIVGYSRIYLGAHWITDVAAGLIIGLGWSLLCRILFLPSTAKR